MPTFTGTEVADTLIGGDEADTINGLGGNDRLVGNGGNDTIDGGTGDDVLAGGLGSDTLMGGDDRDYLFGNVDSAAVFVVSSNDMRAPPAHYFSLTSGDADADVLQGGSGLDVIVAGYGDTVDGGADGASILVSYLGAPHGVTWNSSGSIPHMNVANASFSGWLQGSNFADTLSGRWVLGMGGDDHIITSAVVMQYWDLGARNFVDGGEGNDRIEIVGQASSGQEGKVLRDHPIDPGVTYLPIVFGGAGNDTIIGNATIYGGLGNDTITGDGTISGGEGDDIITGSGTIAGDEGNDRITGSGNISGGKGADTLIGGAGNDTISTDRAIGFDGNTDVDHVNAGAGNDMIFAGYGDHVDGGAGFDTLNLSYIGAPKGITGDTKVLFAGQSLSPDGGTVRNIERFDAVALTQFNDTMVIGDQADPATAYGYGGDDHLIGQENRVVFYGGDGNDLLVGSTANDEIYGESGNDKIIGHLGADSMRGGDGSDIFYWTNLELGDRIRDFQVGIDKIDLTGVDANALVAGEQEFTFIGSAEFSGKAGELRVYQDGGLYYVAGDADGDRVADLRINLESVQVSSVDFFL